MSFSVIRIRSEYKEKLAALAVKHNRSMANMVEVLIDKALAAEEPKQ